jgi:ATP-dependent DNA ligase
MSTKAYQIDPARCKKAMNFEQCTEALKKGGRLRFSMKAEIKYDGIRYLWQIRPNGAKHNYLTSRRTSDVTGEKVEKQDKVPFLRDYEGEIGPDTIFDGEIVCDGISSDTQHEMVSGNVRYKIWDILMFEGYDLSELTESQRRKFLERVKPKLPKGVSVVKQYKPEEALSLAKEKGLEGIVIKDPQAKYGEGWIKVKQEKHADVVIWGYEETKSADWKRKGWIGAVLFGQWKPSKKVMAAPVPLHYTKTPPQPGDTMIMKGNGYRFVDMGRASGFTQDVRQDISENENYYKGKVIEIEYQQRFPTGKFRSPRFNRFRHDKNATDCVYDSK